MATPGTAPSPAPSVFTHRKNILDLTAPELAALREAFSKVYQINDERGFQYQAGIHGYPLPVYCQHGTPLFAVWHRPYLYLFEKALQDQVPGVSLPYWDWAAPEAQSNGLPAAYTDETSGDASGQTLANSLYQSVITFPGTEYPQTFRDPGALSTLRTLARLVVKAQTQTSYVRYTAALENPHNGLHGFVGGTMGVVPYSAYDPIFWAHHVNIDRLFSEWQAAHPDVQPPASIMSTALAPFGMTVSQIWDMKKLGYDYIAASAAAPKGMLAMSATKFNTPVASFSLSQVKAVVPQVELRFHKVKHPKTSFEIRVFLNQPDATAATSIEDNPHYAGSIFVFGHGECGGDAGHCEPPVAPRGVFDLRPPHHLTPMELSLDASDAVAAIAKTGVAPTSGITVTLVAVDHKGKQIDKPGIDFESMSLGTPE
jgi:tyrosinase